MAREENVDGIYDDHRVTFDTIGCIVTTMLSLKQSGCKCCQFANISALGIQDVPPALFIAVADGLQGPVGSDIAGNPRHVVAWIGLGSPLVLRKRIDHLRISEALPGPGSISPPCFSDESPQRPKHGHT